MRMLEALLMPLHLDSSLCTQIAQWTPGYVAADLALLVTDVVQSLSVKKYIQQDDRGSVQLKNLLF